MHLLKPSVFYQNKGIINKISLINKIFMGILYIIIFLGIIFLTIYLFRRPKITMNKTLFISGILLALTGAFLMWNGSILGERTTGIATIIGIVGIGLIATSRKSKKILNQ
ncbi:hypothetical protein AMJ49_02090 [Parcubacteria bacterium DG_74_2]|nr:MAG: hypothetical protein AMJ49_02090 [Parcubacteria bacterium DG_74_2]